MTDFTVVIPARLASTRLPRKALADLDGVPMIERVRRQAEASGARRVVVATDTVEIAECVRRFGGEAVLTDAAHPSGTDRIHEAVCLLGLAPDEIIVNLQGDEPLMPPALVHDLAAVLAAQSHFSMATVACPVTDWEQLFDPNIVKVVSDQGGRALYFSRAPIPWAREAFGRGNPPSGPCIQGAWWRHIGLYAYRAGMLRRYASWPAGALEQKESLEQLRVLENGEGILVLKSEEAPPAGVDTLHDLEVTRRLLADETSFQSP